MSESTGIIQHRLAGQVETEDLGEFDRICSRMNEIGYSGIMTNVFFALAPAGSDTRQQKVLYSDDDWDILLMAEDHRRQLAKIIRQKALELVSSHFLQTLQPFGHPPDWIFPIHEQLLDAAQSAGVKIVTTHFGWMFGESKVALMGDFVEKFNTGQISRHDFLIEKVRRFGGPRKFYQDCLDIYQHLCAQAARRNIEVTIETVPDPFGMEEPAKINAFIDELDADNLGICIDSGHCHAVDIDPARAIRAAGPRMRETHFHDNFGPQKNWSLSDLHNPVGIGTINWLNVLHALNEIGYEGFVTFEQKDFIINAANWKALERVAHKLA